MLFIVNNSINELNIEKDLFKCFPLGKLNMEISYCLWNKTSKIK